MAPTQTLKLRNGPKTDDLKIHLEVNGVIEENGEGQITKNVADETVTIPFRGSITGFDVIRGAGSAWIDGQSLRFQDLVGWDTRDHAGGGSTPAQDTSSAPERDTSGSTSVPVSDASSSIAVERPGIGVVARPFYSQGDIEMHVGDGHEFDSLQAAFNAVPHYLLHECDIFVHGRTGDRNTAHIHSVQMANAPHFTVDGSDGGVINNGGVNVDIVAKLDHVCFENLETEMISQCVDARFQNCTFGHNGRACFSGKTGGKMLIDCEFKAGADYAVESIGNEMVEIRGGTLRADKAAIHAIGASTHVLTGGADVRAPQKITGGARDVFVGGERVN